MDRRLASLIQAVENGHPGPPLRLLLAGGALAGTLVPARVFHEAMVDSLVVAGRKTRKGQGLKRLMRNDSPDEHELTSEVNRLLEPLRPGAAEEGAVTLQTVKWWSFDNKTTLEMPAIRIPFEAISAWWISGETGEQASTWYVGAVVSAPSS